MGSKQSGRKSLATSTSLDNVNVHVHYLPYHRCPLQKVAQLVIEQNSSCLPDLNQVVVLLAQSRAAAQFRQILLNFARHAGCNALLGPNIDTLQSWVAQFTLADQVVINNDVRELMLVEALMEHPHLYGQGSPWSLASSLIALFDELTRQHVELPQDITQLQKQLSEAYGLKQPELSALGKEATLVHTLWLAMHNQLQALHGIDQTNAEIFKLHNCINTIKENTKIYIAGHMDLSLSEWQWLQNISHKHSINIVVQNHFMETDSTEDLSNTTNYVTDSYIQGLKSYVKHISHSETDSNALNECLNQVYQWQAQPLKNRATQCRKLFSNNPIKDHIAVYEAPYAEAEALAIDIQVRLWLSQGISHIGIVTENRRLARRVRALLERSAISLNDAAGWALSTTSSATVIEKWLQCIEENFHYQPFLDLLKSPFLSPETERDDFLALVYRFEQGIILQENIACDIDRYLLHIDLRMQRLPDELARYYQNIPLLLQKIKQSAQPMVELMQSGPQSPRHYLTTLKSSLNDLGIIAALQIDEAGSRVMMVIDHLVNSVANLNLAMNWTDFRAWLGRAFEEAYFQPPHISGPVQLMSLTQSDLQSFDAVIIAAAEQEYLPGAPVHSPFFNDAVRIKLGLRSLQYKNQDKYYYFRRLLQSTPAGNGSNRVLITRRIKDNNEDIIASPWLEAIQSFHQQAYKTNLDNNALIYLVADLQSQIYNADAPLPTVEPPNPAATVNEHLLPTNITASAYQQLVNCPYQFFAARCLKLAPPETVKELLEKSDYGERVHLCLQAFHKTTNALPGPFIKPLNEKTKHEAVELLTLISKEVFSKDIEDNYVHRSWLNRWQELIPTYIDWQIDQSQLWQVESVELEISSLALNNTCKLSGRLDRVDRNGNQARIIDYKTGFVPKQHDVESGEAIQLPFYAILADSFLTGDTTVTSVDYLSLTSNGFGVNSSLSGKPLHNLKSMVAARLTDMISSVQSGQALPAWGDSNTCDFCQMQGLCRLQAWGETGD